jgi:arabinogalactan endo-1,4-beta-galactosidase
MNDWTRRQLLIGSSAVLAGGAFQPTARADDTSRRRPRQSGPEIRGADLSFTLQVEAAGGSFSDGGQEAAVERILADHGATHVRLRVWTDPPDGYSDLASALELASRARQAGLGLLIDPHYSDFWADPGKQPTPAAWQGQDLDTLADTVREYTRDLVTAFAEQGTPIDILQVGNEITAGMLWPTGQIYQDDGEHWPEFCTLLAAGIEGAREASQAGQPLRIMLHIDRGGNNGDCQYFYDHVLDSGIEFDVIGLSFYPFWHGSIDALRANLADLAPRYGKDIVVAETSYPWTLDDGDDEANFVTSADQLPDDYPPTPEGQQAFLTDLAGALVDTPNGRGLGFFVWEPEWLPVVGWQPGAGNPNDNLTLFDWTGAALPGIAVFGR